MLVRPRFPWQAIIAQLWPITLVIALYSCLVSWIDANFHLERYLLPSAVGTIPGAFVGVLLAFRTNSSYGRWWEARILWGSIVNDSRTWVRRLVMYASDGNKTACELITRMSHRQIAWCYALTSALRRQEPWNDLEHLLQPEEMSDLKRHTNVPNALLFLQTIDLRKLRELESIDTWQSISLEETLESLTNSMGGCERIRNTPFPPHYQTWVHYLIYLFIALLPFTFVDAHAVVMILVTVSIALGFLVVEKVAMYLENPFNEPLTGTPMSTLSRTIEINLRQMLGESSIPPQIEPKNDVLY